MPATGAVPSRERLDRYQLVEKIGRGGMAEVFRARMCSIGGFEREVAVKVLLPEYASEVEFVDMLLDEARIAGSIVHPCVVQVLDIGRSGDTFYLVMEYVRGTDVRSLARTVPAGKLPLPMALFVVGEMLRGLQAVHGAVDASGWPRRIVHRDVSPANVLVGFDGTVKLGDFGIAHASGRLTHTRVGLVKGKSRYMAPEQLLARPVDHRADLYAAGVTLFEALLGDVARESSQQTPHGPMFTWPKKLPPELVPDDVAAILRRAVVDDPKARFADAGAFRRAIAAALSVHAPGYDCDALARQLRQLKGQAEPAQDLASSSEAATELRPSLPGATPAPAQPRSDSKPQRVSGAMVPLRSAPPASPDGPSGALPRVDSKPLRVQPPAVAEPYRPSESAARPRPRTISSQVEVYRANPGAGDAQRSGVYNVAQAGLYASDAATPFRGTPSWNVMPQRRPLAWVGGGVLAAALIAAVISMSSAEPLPAAFVQGAVPSAIDAPQVTPLPAPTPPATTGSLAVGGPTGAKVSIAGVAYPPAPCLIELPPGKYDVLVRARRRKKTRTVTIQAGITTTF